MLTIEVMRFLAMYVIVVTGLRLAAIWLLKTDHNTIASGISFIA